MMLMSSSSESVRKQVHALFVEGDTFRGQVIRPDDRRVSRRVAAREIALLEHGDVGDAVARRQIIGSCQPMSAAADDDHIVAGFECGLPSEVRFIRVSAVERGADGVLEQSKWHGESGSRARRAGHPRAAFHSQSAKDFPPVQVPCVSAQEINKLLPYPAKALTICVSPPQIVSAHKK